MYQRYANPLELLDLMIDTGRLEEFLCEMLQFRKEENEDEMTWEYWLHRVWGMDWNEYYASRHDMSSTTEAAPTQDKLTDTVKASAQMLMSFCPDCGGEQHGTVQIDGNNSG